MGRLIKNHWARLVILTSAMIQIGASMECFIWPKVFWDFSTEMFNPLIQTIPTLQITNILLGLAVISSEWPIRYLAGTVWHRNIVPRLLVYPICSFWVSLMYQGPDAGLYYLIGTGIYLWAFIEGETVGAEAWTIPISKRESQLESGQSPPASP